MGTFVKLAVFIILVYLGVIAALPYVKHKTFENAVENVLKNVPDSEITGKIIKAAAESGIELTNDNIVLDEYVNKVKYTVKYTAHPASPLEKITYNFMLEGYKNIEAK